MKKVLTIAAVLEVATGMALLIVPSLVGRLLFGEEFTGIVIAVARVLGIALVALGVGCLPGSTALCGMLFAGGYNFETPPPQVSADGTITLYPPTGYRTLNARTAMFFYATGITPAMCM